MTKQLVIDGYTGFSTLDWPGQLAAVVWCQGCNLDCAICHNKHLVTHEPNPATEKWDQLLAFLEKRKRALDAVVFSGGEPTVQRALPEALSQAKAMGFKVGLHTNGTLPKRVRLALPWCDWVAVDYKMPLDRYKKRFGIKGEKVLETIVQVIDSGVDYEVRTTVAADKLSDDDVRLMVKQLRVVGVEHYRLQAKRPGPDRPWGRGLTNEFLGVFKTFSVRPGIVALGLSGDY